MIEVRVKKQGVLTHEAKFETQGEVDAWLAQNEASKAFGKPQRWVHQDDLLAQGEDQQQAIESREVGGPDELKYEYKFAAEYTVEQADITAQVAEERKLQLRLAKQSFGALMIAKITELNNSKNLTQEQLGALLADMNAAAIERLLWSGSLTFAKAAIAGYSGLYSTEEKAALVAEIDAWLLANPEA